MSWFKKKSPEVIDYSLMQKRGLIPKQEVQEDKVIDLRQSAPAVSGNSSSSGFDFLNSMAAASSEPSSSISDSLREARRKSSPNAEINMLKVQMDNLDFKINNLMDKITEINSKLRDKGI